METPLSLRKVGNRRHLLISLSCSKNTTRLMDFSDRADPVKIRRNKCPHSYSFFLQYWRQKLLFVVSMDQLVAMKSRRASLNLNRPKSWQQEALYLHFKHPVHRRRGRNTSLSFRYRHKHVVTVEFTTKLKLSSSSAEGRCLEFLESSNTIQSLVTHVISTSTRLS